MFSHIFLSLCLSLFQYGINTSPFLHLINCLCNISSSLFQVMLGPCRLACFWNVCRRGEIFFHSFCGSSNNFTVIIFPFNSGTCTKSKPIFSLDMILIAEHKICIYDNDISYQGEVRLRVNFSGTFPTISN